jgi:hypothetical protein
MRLHRLRYQACLWLALLVLSGAASVDPAFASGEDLAAKATAEIDQIRADQALISELAGMGAVAREMRERFIALRKGADEAERAQLDTVWKARYAPVDKANADRLKVLLGDGPWFRRSRIGPIAEQAAVSIVNHSNDLAFQKLMLVKMEALGREVPSGYANLYDRVAVQEGRPQRYATQAARCVSGKSTPPVDLEDPANVDARRRQVGLEPLTAYLAGLDKTYGPCTGVGR